jgi:hypothetical protein
MRKAQMITLQTDNGILITFDTSVSCPQSFGLEAGFKDEDCKYENCDKCWEKAIEQIEDISVLIQLREEKHK